MLDQPQLRPGWKGKWGRTVRLWVLELVLAYREELSDQLSQVYCVAHMHPVRIIVRHQVFSYSGIVRRVRQQEVGGRSEQEPV